MKELWFELIRLTWIPDGDILELKSDEVTSLGSGLTDANDSPLRHGTIFADACTGLNSVLCVFGLDRLLSAESSILRGPKVNFMPSHPKGSTCGWEMRLLLPAQWSNPPPLISLASIGTSPAIWAWESYTATPATESYRVRRPGLFSMHCLHALLLYLHVISHVSQPFSTASPQLPQVAPPCRGNVKGFQLRLLRTDGPLSSSQMHAVAHKHSQVQGASVRVTRLVFPLDFQIRTNHIDTLYHFTISNDRNRISHHFVFGYRWMPKFHTEILKEPVSTGMSRTHSCSHQWIKILKNLNDPTDSSCQGHSSAQWCLWEDFGHGVLTF